MEIKKKTTKNKTKKYFKREGLSFYKSSFLLITFVLQLTLLLTTFIYFAESFVWIYVISIIFSVITSFRVLIASKNPAAKVSWIMLVLIFPSFGFLIYFIAGGSDIHPQHKSDIRKINAQADPLLPKNDFSVLKGAELQNAKFLANTTNSTAYEAQNTAYYTMGSDALKAVIHELKKAKKTIYLEYYIVNRGDVFSEILNILIDKASEGVDVRLIYDGFGGKDLMNRQLKKVLKAANIKFATFTPISLLFTFYMNYRDHRKLVIIDNNVCFTGGFNIADEYANIIKRFEVWKDSGIKIEGPAVNYFSLEFMKMWTFVTKDKTPPPELVFHPSSVINNDHGVVVPYVTGPYQPTSVARSIYINLISNASHSINLMTPYFVVDEAIIDLLKTKAASGVEVNLFIPGVPDKKIVYSLTKENAFMLSRAGCNVYVYKPGFLHSKNLLIDKREAIVGSINFDYRSFYQLYEGGVYFTDPKLVAEVAADFVKTSAECEKVDPTKIKKRSIFYRLYIVLLKWASPLM